MKLLANLTLYKAETPSTHSEVGIEEVVAEDVKSFEFTENGIIVHFNTSEDQFIPLRDNDGVGNSDWRAANLQITRKFLKLE